MNVLDATRAWLRENCPYIDKRDRFNANYLDAEPVAYALRIASEDHVYDVLGFDQATVHLVFVAQLPYGKEKELNLSAADFFARLSAWLRGQERAHNYPQVSGYTVTRLTASNAGQVTQAMADMARYQLQIKIEMEET